MAREFSAEEAKTVFNEIRNLQRDLRKIPALETPYPGMIKEAADALVLSETMKILSGIPVEELNRGKRGIKVKTLRDNGFNTIADVAWARWWGLASIYGISEDAAYTIDNIARNIFDQTRKTVKIRLSTDQKTYETTTLVVKISSLLRLQFLSERSRQIDKSYSQQIDFAMKDLSLATKGGLSWFFASKKKKQQASYAYQYLSGLLSGDYGNDARYVIKAARDVQNLSPYDAWNDFQQNSIRFFNILERIVPGVLGTNDAQYGLPDSLAKVIQEEAFFPDGLLCSLRRYQEWGVKYILHQEKVLLGDEMGLGKTVQAIASMVSLRNTGATHFVVICPASVITNWCREITEKSRLRVIKVHGPDKSQALRNWIADGGVAVTTYETAGLFAKNKSIRFSMLVLDEAHYVKNPSAQRTMNVRSVANYAERLLFMTGTPIENKVEEMISLIDMLQPAVANQIRGLEFLSAASQFRQKVIPVYYRRKREDVLTELPEKTENKEWCTMLPEEEAAYEYAILNHHYADARRVSWNINDLRRSSKATRMLEIIKEAESEGRKVLVFSFFLETIRNVAMLLGNRCMNPINGSVPPARRQEIIDQFDAAPAGTVLAAQIQSGGTGLNIQSASVVIICEPQFKPSIENQAISRAYRMGQTRNVLIYRLLCVNTIDEKITRLLEEKQAVFDAFADKSEAAKQNIELDDKTFGDIIKSEIDRINAKNRFSQNFQ